MPIFKKIRTFSFQADAETEMIGQMMDDKVPEIRLYQAILYTLFDDLGETDRRIKRRMNCFNSWDWNGKGVPPNEVGTMYIHLQTMERLEKEARTSARIKELCEILGMRHSAVAAKAFEIAIPHIEELKKPYWQMVKKRRMELVMAGEHAQEIALTRAL